MDRLADRNLSALTFTTETTGGLPKRASVVVGSGIVGSSIAFHLAHTGLSDVLLVERNVLTSGTTQHAAGLVANACESIASPPLRNPMTNIKGAVPHQPEWLDADWNTDFVPPRPLWVTVAGGKPLLLPGEAHLFYCRPGKGKTWSDLKMTL